MGTLTLKSGLMFLFVLAISSPHGSTNPFYAIGKLTGLIKIKKGVKVDWE